MKLKTPQDYFRNHNFSALSNSILQWTRNSLMSLLPFCKNCNYVYHKNEQVMQLSALFIEKNNKKKAYTTVWKSKMFVGAHNEGIMQQKISRKLIDNFRNISIEWTFSEVENLQRMNCFLDTVGLVEGSIISNLWISGRWVWPWWANRRIFLIYALAFCRFVKRKQ